jgi:succinyl-CoA synthetase alpha subunit
MGILLSSETNVVVQGITGREGSYWTEHMLGAGTRIVAGVTPGREGQEVLGVPVYDTVRRAAAHAALDASVIFVPPRFAKDAAFEALDAGMRLIVLLADGLPLREALEIRAFSEERQAIVLGPNTPGMLTVGQAMLGFFPYWLESVYRPGQVGLVSRSGSLINEVASRIVAQGHGLTSAVGVGGDACPCTRAVQIVRLFAEDPQSKAIVLVGEIGGSMEEEVAEFMAEHEFGKPLIAYIAGRTAPPGKRMGHAGAIVQGAQGGYESKRKALEKAGALVASTTAEVGILVRRVLGQP